jgi:hypothetical protein
MSDEQPSKQAVERRSCCGRTSDRRARDSASPAGRTGTLRPQVPGIDRRWVPLLKEHPYAPSVVVVRLFEELPRTL